MRSRGQVSTELLVVIGFILIVFIPLLITVYFKGSEMNEQLAISQSRLAVTRLAALTNAIGYLGENASIVAEVFIPSNVEGLSFKNIGTGGEVIINITIADGSSEIAEPVHFKFEQETKFTAPPQGLTRLAISSTKGKIAIKKVD